jgi:hypothetical protein
MSGDYRCIWTVEKKGGCHMRGAVDQGYDIQRGQLRLSTRSSRMSAKKSVEYHHLFWAKYQRI